MMPLAETIPSQIEYYEYSGQPRDEWPDWLKAQFHISPLNRKGHIATAHFDNDDGKPEWYRWFEPDQFWRNFRQVTQASIHGQ